MIKRHDKQDGFIALTSAILISVILLAITLTISLSGYFARFNVFDSESKERTVALAEACGDSAILEVSGGIYSTNKIVNVGPATDDKCTIVSAQADQPATGQFMIKTQSVVNKVYTNMVIVLDSTFTITTWEECTNLTSSTTSC
jgi:hypothetical protein